MEAIYQRDSDQDGLTDAQELALGTNPLSADSDGDGRSDLVEIEEGTNSLEKDLQDIDQTSITEPSSVFMEMKQKISDMMESHYCLLYTSPSPRDRSVSRMPSSA